MRLNLGCGKDRPAGWENVDLENADVCLDLDTHPWPWADGSVERIYASHIIEHLKDFANFMAECHRVLEPGGELVLETPHPLCEWFWQDPTHVRGYTCNTFAYYCTDAIAPSPDYGLTHFASCRTGEREVPEAPGIPPGARVVWAVLVK
jgi:ubiquinone/menaquinone biosynthesis C-methylase UbiE